MERKNGSCLYQKGTLSRRQVVGLGMAAGLTFAIAEMPHGVTATQDGSGELTVYSGRNENLIGLVLDSFTEATGIRVNARYGGTAELAATILEEGENSPADLFIAQDAGALGALQNEGRFASVPGGLLERIDSRFGSPEGLWVGVSGRARVAVYNTELVDPAALPESVDGLLEESWKDSIGWAPTNGSFQSFVTAYRVLRGDDEARVWLDGMKSNGAISYEGNGAITRAVGTGEIPAGLVNHYYMYEVQAEEGELPLANHFFGPGDPGTLVNVAGAGLMSDAAHADEAVALLDYLLSSDAQAYFAESTWEYPLIEGVEPSEDLPPLSELESPDIDLSDLSDLEGTLNLLADTGVL